MNLFAVIPVKPFAEGKSRLKNILTNSARHDLNIQMFQHVFNVTSAAIGVANTIVVSADQYTLDMVRERGAHAVFEDVPAGLNGALKLGTGIAVAKGADAVLILPTDLPTLSPEDIRALVDRRIPPCVVIAPDRANQGTNALLLSPPDAIKFSFGKDSFTAHRKAALDGHIDPAIVKRDGLALDIDTPEDYSKLSEQGGDAIRAIKG